MLELPIYFEKFKSLMSSLLRKYSTQMKSTETGWSSKYHSFEIPNQKIIFGQKKLNVFQVFKMFDHSEFTLERVKGQLGQVSLV